MKGTIAIVPMAERHLAALAELEALCFSSPRSEETLKADLFNPLCRFFVAEKEGDSGQRETAGYGGMQNVCGECYVEDIAVFPAFRGKGIGRQLTEQLIKTAEEEGCAFVTLEVRVSNEAAIGLYRSLGFEAVGVRKSFYEKPTEDALLMTKYLQPKATE